MIVPVMIGYDRIYESINLATEMINGEKRDYTLYGSMALANKTREDVLGHIYLKYLEPVNLEQWMKTQINGKPICQSNMENFESPDQTNE